jgi:DNA-binding LacI/PurR family transcriptional regulator
MLVRLIRGETPEETHVRLATKLIVRQSTNSVEKDQFINRS